MKFQFTYIKYSQEWDEYSVHVKGNPKATYYTDNKHDAKESQKAMEFAEIERRK